MSVEAPTQAAPAAPQTGSQMAAAKIAAEPSKPSIESLTKAAFAEAKSQQASEQVQKQTSLPPAEPPKQAATEPAKPAQKTSLLSKAAEPEPAKPSAEADPTGPEDAISLPENADPTKKSQFNEMKKIIKELRREKMSQQTQQTLQQTAQPAADAETERLRAEHKQMADRLAILDLQSHPDFARQYSEPKNKAVAEANEVLAFNNKEADLKALLAKPQKEFNAALAEVIKDLNPVDATTVVTAMRTAYKTDQAEKQALTKASELASNLQSQSAHNAKKAFESVWKDLGPTGYFLTTLEAGQEATAEEKTEISKYNEAVGAVRAAAEKYAFGQSDPKQAASLATKAATLDFMLSHGVPRMQKEYSQLVSLNRQMAEELAALKGQKSVGSVAGAAADSGGGSQKTSVQDLVAQAYGTSGKYI